MGNLHWDIGVTKHIFELWEAKSEVSTLNADPFSIPPNSDIDHCYGRVDVVNEEEYMDQINTYPHSNSVEFDHIPIEIVDLEFSPTLKDLDDLEEKFKLNSGLMSNYYNWIICIKNADPIDTGSSQTLNGQGYSDRFSAKITNHRTIMRAGEELVFSIQLRKKPRSM